MGLVNFRGEKHPYYRTADGKEVPAVFVIGGRTALTTFGDEDVPLLIDPETQSLVSISHVHHMVHIGEMFHAEYSFGAVGNGNNADIRFVTSTQAAHTVFFVGNSGQGVLYLYEAPTQSGGTPVTAHNMNRSSAHVTGVQVFHTPAVVGVGTTALVPGRIIPGGTTGQSRVGGDFRTETEWELKPNTEYLLRINNNSGLSSIISIGVEFYERP